MSRDVIISVEEGLLAEAKSRAASEHLSIDTLVQKWLAEYVAGKQRVERYRELMQRLSYVSAGRKFTREEMNER
jgi:hypothetical protein